LNNITNNNNSLKNSAVGKRLKNQIENRENRENLASPFKNMNPSIVKNTNASPDKR